MADNECKAIKEFIGSRVNFAIFKLGDDNPRYQEVCKNQEKNWQTVDVILRKLEDKDRRAVLRYYEDEVHKFSFESDGAYLQGVRDCFSMLAFFGVLGGRCPRGTSKE